MKKFSYFSIVQAKYFISFFLFLLPFLYNAKNADGLVANYTFNNANANDETGRFNAKGSGISFVADRFGNPKSSCFLYGNYASYLNLGTAKELKPQKMSVALWIKIDMPIVSGRGYSVNPIILTKRNDGDDFFEAYTMVYEYDTKKIVAAISRSERLQLSIHSADSFPIGEWHHLAMTYDNQYACLYIDGALEGKIPKNFGITFLDGDSVLVGNSANSKNFRFLCASVDDIFIYDRALTPDEIKDLFNAPDPNRYNKYFKWMYRGMFALVIIVILSVLFMWWYKKKIEKEKEQHSMNVRINELENRAIRAQMNPHFMFNSLNTLQRFILEKDFEKAEGYIGIFSRLQRKLLESSVADSIPLSEELDILEKYICIEKLRFDDEFEYTIQCDIQSPEKLKIPFMLIQPFVENAIWHGLIPAEDRRSLLIFFSQLDSRRIRCIVDDNGVGLSLDSGVKNSLKKKSLALDLIRQRLELIKKSCGIDCGFSIIDKKSFGGQGTKVEIIFPILS